jgi:peptidoglycan/LPS O-acetylase OafA/YrhL/lysophospholipase L1-like esterase
MTDGPTRVASLDLVRGLAAFLVAIPHYFILNSTQWPAAEVISILSVEVFFVLSGYVLTSQIIYCSQEGRFTNLAVFLVRRWMRTIPPYLVALVALSLITGQLGTADFARYALYVQNLFVQHNNKDYFTAAWSLSVEEWFYVTFPLLTFCAVKLCHRSDFTFYVVLALVFIGIITVVRTLFGHIDTWDESVRRVVIFRLDSIAFGFLLYLLVDRVATDWASNVSLRSVGIAIIVLGTAAVVGFEITRGAAIDSQHVAQHFFPFAAAAFGASAIVAFLSLERFIAQGRFLTQFCLFMGRISYSIYLFHITLILLLRPKIEALPIAIQIGIYISVLVTFSSMFYLYFEKPILAARPRFTRAENTELHLDVYLRSLTSRFGAARRQITAIADLTRIEVFWRIVGIGLPIAAVTISAYVVRDSFLFNKAATLFYGSTLFLAASVVLFCWSIGLYRFGPVRVLVQSFLFVAALMPFADLLFSSQQQQQAHAVSNEAPKPVYLFREAKGNPAAFQAWWTYYVKQWTSDAQLAVEIPDPKGILPLLLKPNSSGKFFESEIHINNLGFRGPDIDPKKADRFRVVALGESPTFGPTLRPGDRPWPELLQDKIDTRLTCARPIQVINAGTPAYDLKDNLERVRRDILPLKPDVVLSYHSFNSLHLLDNEIVAGAPEPPKPLLRPSPLLAAVEHRFDMLHFVEALKQHAKAVVPTPAAALNSDLAHYYEELIRVGREHNFMPVLANPSLAATSKSPNEVIDFYRGVFPNTWRILAASDVHDQLIRNIAHRSAVPFVDTTPGLNGEWDADLFIDLVHFTWKGNEVMAERMFDGLKPLVVGNPTLRCFDKTNSR